MLFKNKLLFLPVLLLIMGACTYEIDNVYDKSATERYKETVDKVRNDLLMAEKGWIMEYFPTVSSQGYVLFVKFETKDSVVFAAKNSLTQNVYKEAGSRYQILSNSTPILSFNTYNDIFHKFSDPAPNGAGLEGDFEFFIVTESEDLIELNGRKRDTRIIMRKMTGDDFQDYFNKITELKNRLFGGTTNDLLLRIGDQTLIASKGYSGVFTLTPEGQESESITSYTVPYIVNLEGIRFQKLFEYNGKKIETFVLDEETQHLVSVDPNVNAFFEGVAPLKYFVSELQTKKWAIDLNDEKMGPIMLDKINAVRTGLRAKNRTLSQLDFGYLSDRKSVVLAIQLKASNGDISIGYFDYSFEEVNDGITSKFLNTFDEGGKVLYSIEGFADLTQTLSTTFKVSADFKLNQSVLKLESTTDSNVWFYVKRLEK
jgi:hypothetical protein